MPIFDNTIAQDCDCDELHCLGFECPMYEMFQVVSKIENKLVMNTKINTCQAMKCKQVRVVFQLRSIPHNTLITY